MLIASSTKITLNGSGITPGGIIPNGTIFARGGDGGSRGCEGAGGAVRLVANSIIGSNNQYVYVDYSAGSACKTTPQYGLVRFETNSLTYSYNYVSGPHVTSLPFQLNLPTVPFHVITVSSINGIAINANPFSFPDATINTAQPVPVVVLNRPMFGVGWQPTTQSSILVFVRN